MATQRQDADMVDNAAFSTINPILNHSINTLGRTL
jgi:hypothetical protein